MEKIVILIIALLVVAGYALPDKKVSAALETELKKDFSVFRVLSISDATAMDAFGNSLLVNAWYVRSNKTKNVFPIMIQSDSTEINVLSCPLSDYDIRKEKVRLFVNNGTASAAKIKAEFIITSWELKLSKDRLPRTIFDK